MQVTVDIPDQFVPHLVPPGQDVARALLEEVIARAYREHRLTMEQTRQLLGYNTRMQVNAFLQKHEISDYTVEEFNRDLVTHERLFGRNNRPGA